MTDITKELKPGDRFRFEQITVQARKMSKEKLVRGTQSHKAVLVTFSKSGIVFIDKT